MSHRPGPPRQVGARTRPADRSRSGWERALIALLGGVFGVLFSCCLGIVALSALDSAPASAPATPLPTEYGIEAIVEESYVNRAVAAGSVGPELPPFVQVVGVDVRPGGLVDFTVELALGLLRPALSGTASLRVNEAGRLVVAVQHMQMGRLSITPLAADRFLDPVNEQINRQLTERTSTMGVRLLSISSDETTLRLYLTSAY